jgi:hypothetical protein
MWVWRGWEAGAVAEGAGQCCSKWAEAHTHEFHQEEKWIERLLQACIIKKQ